MSLWAVSREEIYCGLYFCQRFARVCRDGGKFWGWSLILTESSNTPELRVTKRSCCSWDLTPFQKNWFYILTSDFSWSDEEKISGFKKKKNKKKVWPKQERHSQKYKNGYGKNFFPMLGKIKAFIMTQKDTFTLSFTVFHESNFWTVQKSCRDHSLGKKKKKKVKQKKFHF